MLETLDKKTSRTETGLAQQLQSVLKPSWLENTDLFSRIKADRLPHTAEWILQEQPVAQWLDQKLGNIVVVTGPPASGKTFLASKVVDKLLSNYQQDGGDASRVSAAYFFCKERLANMSSLAKMLRTVAYQIAAQDKLYIKHIKDRTKELTWEYDVEELWKLLFYEYFSKARGSSYVLIDSIDECDANDVRDLWKAMSKYPIPTSTDSASKLNLLFMTRTERAKEMVDTLGPNVSQVVLDGSQGAADLAYFVKQRLHEAFEGTMISSALLGAIRTMVMEVANGNYLHASVTVERLKLLHREDMIRKFIDNPQRDLDDTVRYTLVHLTSDMDSKERADFQVRLIRNQWSSLRYTKTLVGHLRLGGLLASLHDRGAA